MAASSPAFFDTNVLLYLISADEPRADRAEELLAQGGTISVQVLNEFTAVARGRYAVEWDRIAEILAVARQVCRVQPLTEAVHDRGRALAERHKLGVYDAMIVAAALEGGCTVLWTEDLHDGWVVDERLTVRNPFVAAEQ